MKTTSKAALRQMLEARRRALNPTEAKVESTMVQQSLATLPAFMDAYTLGLYKAQSFEVQTEQLFMQARARSARCAYPRIVQGERMLRFHELTDATQVLSTPSGLMQPAREAPEVPLEEIDCFIVPGVGFTRTGQRLGRGGGYYDATLALRRTDAWAVGITWTCGLMDALPMHPHDVTLDVVVAPNEVFMLRER